MKKIFLLYFIIPALSFANNSETITKKIEQKIIKQEKIKNWRMEDRYSVYGDIKTNYFIASIISDKNDLKLQISCRLIDGSNLSKKEKEGSLKIEVNNFNDNFILENQYIYFIFNKNYENIFASPRIIKNNEKISFDKKTLIISTEKNMHYQLANKIALNKNLIIKYKTDKNIEKNISFNLDGAYQAISYLGNKCFKIK